eukprot:jgi/Phyca11/129760/e_gw1.87.84.1
MRDNAARTAVQTAIALRRFPPALDLPETRRDSLLSTWLSYPTLTWAPESLTGTSKAVCIVKGCSCTPTVKEYKQRTVHDIEHKTILYYARYSCAGVSKGTTFATIDDDYIFASKVTFLAFPYLLTYKSGVAKELFDLVYDSMLTTKGISGAISNVTRRRQKRYYHLKSLAAMAVDAERLKGNGFLTPLLATVEEYMSLNVCIDEETLLRVWLDQTQLCSRLLEAQIAHSKCKRLIRIDHSQKFCSKLIVYGANGQKDQSASVRMLLLVQNEIGQIVARGLTRSENHEESAAILKLVVFGNRVETKQDPFHVIQRFTEKLTDQSHKKTLSEKLSSATYDVSGNIRSPDAMAELFLAVLDEVKVSSARTDATT